MQRSQKLDSMILVYVIVYALSNDALLPSLHDLTCAAIGEVPVMLWSNEMAYDFGSLGRLNSSKFSHSI